MHVGRRRRGVALGAATCLFVLASAAGIVGAVLTAARQHDAALSAAHLGETAATLNGLEWQSNAEGGFSPEVSTETRAARATFDSTIAVLAEAHLPLTEGRELSSAARTYGEALDLYTQALLAGDVVRARVLDQSVVDPAFEMVHEKVHSTFDLLQASAKRAQQIAVVLAGGTVPVTVLLVWVVWRREARLRRHQLQAERDSAARFEAMVRHATDLFAITDASGGMVYRSPSVDDFLGRHRREPTSPSMGGEVHPDDQARVAVTLERVLGEPGGQATTEFRIRHHEGGWRVLEAHLQNMLANPLVAGVVWNCRDVTERRALEQQLSEQAFHDGLTGLANRALLADRLGQELMQLTRTPSSVALIVFDLDGFKDVNDSLGHQAGDQLLVEVARRVNAVLRPGDTAARLGGDEFALLLAPATPSQAMQLAHRIGREVAAPNEIGGQRTTVTASIGVTTTNDSGSPAASLLRDADTAMYEAKARGKACSVLFEEGMHRAVRNRLELTADLREALANREITVAYQPLIDLDSQQIQGFEALARWVHATRGSVPPDVFIPVAEEAGLVKDLDLMVLDAACRQVRAWQQSTGSPLLGVSVNISGRHWSDPHLVTDVRRTLTRTGLSATTLTLEITETAVVEDPLTVATRLRQLHDLGVRIAVDDFGTGYSSLACLRQLPIDILKIDKSFVQEAHGKRGKALLSGVFALGHALDLDLVAEGIEDVDQLERVHLGGCQTGQGFLFAHALPPGEAEALLTASPPSGSVRSRLADDCDDERGQRGIPPVAAQARVR